MNHSSALLPAGAVLLAPFAWLPGGVVLGEAGGTGLHSVAESEMSAVKIMHVFCKN